MTDAIEAARRKASKKWDKLNAQTVPLYSKMLDGEATTADIKQLEDLYKTQSDLAAKTFSAGIDAAKDSAKEATKEAIKGVVKSKNLLSSKEISKVFETAISVAFEKSALIIKQAVEECLETPIEKVTELITDVRRMQLKTDEIVQRLRNQETFISKEAKLLFEDRSSFLKRVFSRAESNTEQLRAMMGMLSTSITASVISAIEKFEERRAKSGFFSKLFKREKFSEAFSKDFMRQQRKLYASQAKDFISSLKSVIQRTFDRDDFGEDRKSSFFKLRLFSRGDSSDYSYNDSSFLSRAVELFSSTTDSGDYKPGSDDAVRSTSDVSSVSKLKDAVQGYREKYENYDDEEREAALHAESTLSDKLFTKFFLLADKFTAAPLEKAEKNFVRNLEEQGFEYDDIRDDLEQLKKGQDDQNNFSRTAYNRYRELVARDLKVTWTKAAKEKLEYTRKRLRRYTSKSAKAFKIFGIAYLASLVINSLNTIVPDWKKSIFEYLTDGQDSFLSKLGKNIGDFIGSAITGTLSWIWENKVEIAKFVYNVVSHMVKSIVKAALSLVGIDYDAVFGGQSASERADEVNKNIDEFAASSYGKEAARLTGETSASRLSYYGAAGDSAFEDDPEAQEKARIIKEKYEAWKQSLESGTKDTAEVKNTLPPAKIEDAPIYSEEYKKKMADAGNEARNQFLSFFEPEKPEPKKQSFAEIAVEKSKAVSDTVTKKVQDTVNAAPAVIQGAKETLSDTAAKTIVNVKELGQKAKDTAAKTAVNVKELSQKAKDTEVATGTNLATSAKQAMEAVNPSQPVADTESQKPQPINVSTIKTSVATGSVNQPSPFAGLTASSDLLAHAALSTDTSYQKPNEVKDTVTTNTVTLETPKSKSMTPRQTSEPMSSVSTNVNSIPTVSPSATSLYIVNAGILSGSD